MKRAGVLGFPLGQSLSPAIHHFWAAREGAAVSYDAIATPPGYESFAATADRLAREGYAGVNITIPHKENALRYALARGTASEKARRAGAANMLTLGAAPYADNSDIEGFSAALREILTEADRRGRAVLLGAGGAARGVVLALKELGFADILVANRTRARAEALRRDLDVGAVDWGAREAALSAADLLVNATSLGMTGEPPLEIGLDRLPESAIVSDIVYKPLTTPLLAAARARGLRTVDGLSMLMHQAVPAYRAWLGRDAAVDGALRAALERLLAGASAR
ncbi:MAG: shikimate dehydrogenase [Amphiplicatus sp.]